MYCVVAHGIVTTIVITQGSDPTGRGVLWVPYATSLNHRGPLLVREEPCRRVLVRAVGVGGVFEMTVVTNVGGRAILRELLEGECEQSGAAGDRRYVLMVVWCVFDV